MMYKLLAVSTENVINIGDYIQALAASQFLPSVDGYIQRELLNEYNQEVSKVIMNGWYMHHPENWPPSPKIDPLFVAFHINSSVKDYLLSPKSIDYLKKNEPIGCRDMYTVELLQQKGVDAYFSGCLTLTLGYKYKSAGQRDKCYFVDPYFVTHWTISTLASNLISLIFNWRAIDIISKKYPEEKKGLRKKLILTTFYREYKRYFTKETLLNAEYICQQNINYKISFNNDQERLAEAERLVKKYANAKLVVTSRIHCALPCLGLGTPVIYTEDADQTEMSFCRLGGLREFFTIIKWDKDHLEPEFSTDEKISENFHPVNKNSWKGYAEELIHRCRNFIQTI